jgi:hypothetical protein
MWGDDIENMARRRMAWLIGALALATVALGGWFWYQSRTPAVHSVAATAPPAPAANIERQIEHPIAQGPDTAALPALNDSDQVVHDSLAGVIGRAPVEQFLSPQNIVRHVVVTVDNLSQRKVAVDLRPIKPTPGQTVVSTQGEITSLGDANFQRYAPLVHAVQQTDVKSLAVIYQRLYPLFQQAYEDLGYPGKYFNDRLVQVIDHLLQAPEVPAPIQVVQPKVFYEYADPSLESRSAGQKLLIRMGPANARIIKAKLRDFRAEIAKNK